MQTTLGLLWNDGGVVTSAKSYVFKTAAKPEWDNEGLMPAELKKHVHGIRVANGARSFAESN